MSATRTLTLTVLCTLLHACQTPGTVPAGRSDGESHAVIGTAPENPSTAPTTVITPRAPIASLPQNSTTQAKSTADSRSGSSERHVRRSHSTGTLPYRDLRETSGLAPSGREQDLLWAINDGGNAPVLHALTRDAIPLGQWPVDAPNRDWEALASMQLNGEPYLILADIGDNLRVRDTYTLYWVREPQIDGREPVLLMPDWTLHFRYDDGPHDAEALSVIGDQILIITKEPPDLSGGVPGGVYRLPIPDLQRLPAGQNTRGPATADVSRVGTMKKRRAGLEARLAARFARVDLNHVTDMAFDVRHERLWILTYRHVLRFDRIEEETWSDALARNADLSLPHSLPQAESLTVTDDSLVWFTSEGVGAPLWVLPP